MRRELRRELACDGDAGARADVSSLRAFDMAARAPHVAHRVARCDARGREGERARWGVVVATRARRRTTTSTSASTSTLASSVTLAARRWRCIASAAPSSTPSSNGADAITIMTFNVLCPEYKRASNGGANGRESEDMAAAEARAEATLAEIASLDADVVCVQEFWHASEGIASLWRERLRECGYEAMHVTKRTSGRCDGLLTATKRDVEVLDARDVLFNDCGDRVATAVRLKKAGVEMIVVNTHLLFPHNENSSLIRLRESFKILGFLHEMFNEPALRGRKLPIVITGDFNGTNNGRVFRFLTSQGFVSALDSTIDAAKRKAWVSHKNHHGELVGVDHMFLLNPSSQITPIGVSWKDAVFAMVRAKIVEKGLVDDVSAFAAFDENGDGTLSRDEFAEFANDIGLCGEKSPGLLPAELEALYESLDKDGNGLVDFGEFVERMDIKGMAACLADPSDSMDISDYMSCSASDRVILPLTESWDQDMWDDGDLRIERASLPDVMIRGEWPDDYCSDHGPLTATFSLRKF